MNLYEDLPPASGESASDQKILIGTTWSKTLGQDAGFKYTNENMKATKGIDKNADIHHNSRQTSIDPQVPSKVLPSKPFMPSSLLFKPRQASVVNNKTNITSKFDSNKIDAKKYNSSFPSELIVDPIIAPSNDIDQGVIELNMNANFDVEDPYDPRRPNDYILYCEEREEQKRLGKLAEENKIKLEELEKARMEMQHQRREAAASKDYQKLLNVVNRDDTETSSMDRVTSGRGRGRGVANLPAWLTQQMNLESQQPVNEMKIDPASNQFDDKIPSSKIVDSNAIEFQPDSVGTKRKFSNNVTKPSNVILLKNMARIVDVDEELEREISKECTKYGIVINCVVHSVNKKEFPRCPDSEEVRIFVHFQRQDAAIRALRDMNGRFFDGRKISAEYFTEEKFKNNDLKPEADEW